MMYFIIVGSIVSFSVVFSLAARGFYRGASKLIFQGASHWTSAAAATTLPSSSASSFSSHGLGSLIFGTWTIESCRVLDIAVE